jgi:hypothetical protein
MRGEGKTAEGAEDAEGFVVKGFLFLCVLCVLCG